MFLFDPAYCETVYRAVGSQPIRPGFNSLGMESFDKKIYIKIIAQVFKEICLPVVGIRLHHRELTPVQSLIRNYEQK